MSNELKAVVTADIRQFVRGMDRVGMTANAAKTASVAAFAAIVASIVAVEKSTIGAAASYETLRIRLQLLNGDMKKGAAEFEKIKKFAEESAFATDEVIDAYIRLRSVAGQSFAQEQIENIAFAAKVAGVSLSTMATRLGQVVLRMKTGQTGALLGRTLMTLGPAFSDQTEELVRMARSGVDAEIILNKMREALNRVGDEGKDLFGGSAEGMKKQLGGLLTGGLSEIGGKPLVEYKKILRELLDMIGEMRGTEEFKELSDALALFLNQMGEIMKSDQFKKFINDMIIAFTTLLNTINEGLWVITKLVAILDSLPAKSPSHGLLGLMRAGLNEISPEDSTVFKMTRNAGIEAGQPGAGKLSDPISITQAQRENARIQRKQLAEQRRTAENTKVFNPSEDSEPA
jgi:hypothetical protein